MCQICSKLMHKNDVIEVVLVSLLLNLNRFRTLFYGFHYWLWRSESLVGSKTNTSFSKATDRHQWRRSGIFNVDFWVLISIIKQSYHCPVFSVTLTHLSKTMPFNTRKNMVFWCFQMVKKGNTGLKLVKNSLTLLWIRWYSLMLTCYTWWGPKYLELLESLLDEYISVALDISEDFPLEKILSVPKPTFHYNRSIKLIVTYKKSQ